MDINNSQSTWPAGSAPPSLETTPEASSAWEHSDECDPEVETRLTLAKATRDQAETARQKVAEEILEATREKCQELLLSGNNALQNAKRLEAEADTWHSEAQAELKQAESIRASAETDGRAVHQNAKRLEAVAEAKHAEAKASLERAESIEAQPEAGRERILADAHRASRDILETARMEAERERMEAERGRTESERVCTDLKGQASLEAQGILETARMEAERERVESERERMESERVCMDLKRQASLEAQGILAQARAIREELEAQRIYADAARLKAWSHDILTQVDEQPDQASVSPGPSTNGNTVSTESTNGATTAELVQATSVQPVASKAPSKPVQSTASSRGKKPAQATSVEPVASKTPSKPVQSTASSNGKKPARRVKAAS